MSEFVTKDSGGRRLFDSGMQRDVTVGKIDYTYCLQGPLLDRWAQLMERGAVKYTRDNWMQANGPEELARFEQSALRHMIQYLRGDRDEDHAAAIIFNLNGAEYVRDRMAATPKVEKLKLQHARLKNGQLDWHDAPSPGCQYTEKDRDAIAGKPHLFRWVKA